MEGVRYMDLDGRELEFTGERALREGRDVNYRSLGPVTIEGLRQKGLDVNELILIILGAEGTLWIISYLLFLSQGDLCNGCITRWDLYNYVYILLVVVPLVLASSSTYEQFQYFMTSSPVWSLFLLMSIFILIFLGVDKVLLLQLREKKAPK